MSEDQNVVQAKHLLRTIAIRVDRTDFGLYNQVSGLEEQDSGNPKIVEAIKLAKDLFRLSTATSLSAWMSAYEGTKALQTSNPQDPVFARALAKCLDAVISDYRDDGQMDQAKTYLEELAALSSAFDREEEIGRRLARSLVGAANGFADQARWSECEECFQRLLRLYGRHQSSVGIAYNLVQGLVNEGINLRQSGQLNLLRETGVAFRLSVATRPIVEAGSVEEIERRLERFRERYAEDRTNIEAAIALAEFLVLSADAFLAADKFSEVEDLGADVMNRLLREHTKNHSIWLNAAGFLFIARTHLEENGRRQAAAESRDTLRRLVEGWTSVFKESDNPVPFADRDEDCTVTLPSERQV